MPVLKGFNFSGGITMSPEFAALLAGLIIYTSAFVAEVVRSGIQSVNQGQWEAAEAIGLSRPRMLRLVILPQALRVIVPPMTSQYLNLTKKTTGRATCRERGCSTVSISVGAVSLKKKKQM